MSDLPHGDVMHVGYNCPKCPQPAILATAPLPHAEQR